MGQCSQVIYLQRDPDMDAGVHYPKKFKEYCGGKSAQLRTLFLGEEIFELYSKLDRSFDEFRRDQNAIFFSPRGCDALEVNPDDFSGLIIYRQPGRTIYHKECKVPEYLCTDSARSVFKALHERFEQLTQDFRDYPDDIIGEVRKYRDYAVELGRRHTNIK